MSTLPIHTPKTFFYLLGICAFVLILILLPGFLGMFIAQSRWPTIWLLALGGLLITLCFTDFRRLIFFTSLTFLLANCGVFGIAYLFMTLRWVFLIAMAIVAFWNWMSGKVKERLRLIDLWALGFIGLAFYSQTYSIMPHLTIERASTLVLFYLAVFWGVSHYIEDEKKVTTMIYQFLYSAFPLFLIGLGMGAYKPFTGIFKSPNTVGVIISLLMPLAFWSYLCDQKKKGLYCIILFAISLFISKSRGGILATAIACGYFLFSYYRAHRATILTWIVMFVGCALLYAELFGSSFFKEYFKWETLSVGGGRLEAWPEVIRLIKLRPWLGFGFGTEDHLFLHFDIVFMNHAGAYAHNSYLGLASQLGLAGVLLFFVPLFFIFFRRAYQLPKMPPDKSFALLLALNASILGGLINAFFESWLYTVGSAFALPFWCLVIAQLQMGRRIGIAK